MIENGAERLFLFLDMEYIHKRRKDSPNMSNIVVRTPIKLIPPIYFKAYSIEIPGTPNMYFYFVRQNF
jgi:hypothetical protein